MNPILQSALGSILRHILAVGAGWFVQKGIWSSQAADDYIAATVLGLLSLGWSMWEKYKSRIKFLAALSAPAGTTENDIRALVKSDTVTPTIFTPPNTIPGVPLVIPKPQNTTTTPPPNLL